MGIINPNSLLSTTPTIPKFYWDVKSQEQRIKVICCLVQQLIDESKDFDATVTELRNALDSAISECKSYTDSEIGELRAQLMLLIEQLESGALAWDVTTGEYKAPTDAARDSFNDVTIHGITVDQLAELDSNVTELSDCGLNVRGLAVFGGYLLGDTFVPNGVFYSGSSHDEKRLTCALLAGAGVLNGYFVTGDLSDDKATVGKLSSACVEGNYIKE